MAVRVRNNSNREPEVLRWQCCFPPASIGTPTEAKEAERRTGGRELRRDYSKGEAIAHNRVGGLWRKCAKMDWNKLAERQRKPGKPDWIMTAVSQDRGSARAEISSRYKDRKGSALLAADAGME